MNQDHQVLAATITALVGIVIGLAAVAALRLARGDRPRLTSAAGLVPQTYRYCPAEQRTRAAVAHADGSATCGDCGTHIPAGDS